MRRALLAVAMALAACKQVDTVHLSFGATATVHTPVGFRCRDSAGKFLDARAVGAGRSFHVAVLVDFIDLGGLPTCRPSDIARWCTDHTCAPITDDPAHDRVCFDFDQQLGTSDAVKAMGDVLAALDGRLITEDGPEQPVIVRGVATAQRCSDLGAPTQAAAYDPTLLVGCAMSCPVQLQSVSGDVLLDLPTLSDQCEASVDACAQAALKP